MSTVAYIHSYPGASPALDLLWAGFKINDWTLIGVDCIGEPCEWPEPIRTIQMGRNILWTKEPRNLPRRLLGTLAHFIFTGEDQCVIVEYDTAIFGKMPQYPKGFTAHLAGGQLPDSDSKHFYHTPWIFDQKTAIEFFQAGETILQEGLCDKGCHGSPDVFLALICERLGVIPNESGTFSANTVEGVFVEPARQAYLDGCWMIHGVKTPEHLKSIIG